jgi:crossover junction endodeoxyribonuclease RusA
VDARSGESEVKLTLPYPVSANRYWTVVRIAGHCAITKTKRARQYQEEVGWIARRAGCNPTLEPLQMKVKVYARDRRKFDIDNVLKVLGDAMNGIIYYDDTQIVRIEAEKFEPDGNPRAEVEISSYRQPIMT